MLNQIMAELVQDALKTGSLIELSHEDKAAKFPLQAAATRTFCRTCLWRYPSAQPSDIFGIQDLLSELNPVVLFSRKQPLAEPVSITYEPSKKPSWIKTNFSVRVDILPPNWMLLSLPTESVPFDATSLHLPGPLIVRLVALISRLMTVARKNDLPQLIPLISHFHRLADSHPLQEQIAIASQGSLSPIPQHLTHDEYRVFLLEDLAMSLQLAFACGLPIEQYNLLAQYYDKLCSPLNELIYVARSLLLLAITIPDSAPHLSPFDELLTLYGSLRTQVPTANPTLSKRLLKDLRLQTYILSKLLPAEYQDELQRHAHSLVVLDNLADVFATGITYPLQFHPFH